MAEDPKGTGELPDARGDALSGAPPAKTGSDKPPAPPERQTKTPDQIIAEQAEELRRKDGEIATERAGRQRAESIAASRTNDAFASAEAQISTGLKSAKERRDALKRDYQTAFEAGDAAKLAQIQIDMSDNAVELRGWENDQRILEARKKRTTEAVVDINEQVIAQLSAPAQRWMRAHPEMIRNGVLDYRMQSIHYQALAEGVEQDTPEYFAFIEKGLGMMNGTRQPTGGDAERGNGGDRQEPRTSHRITSAAPPSREAGGSRHIPTNVSDITLSDAERDQALAEHPELKEHEAVARYAQNKLALLQEGAYDKGRR